MADRFSRTEMLIKHEGMNKLKAAHIAIFGLGGVGGHAAEALVRCGVGAVDLIDCDVVSESNINRQIIATEKTLGMRKTDAAKERFSDIAPDCKITVHDMFFLPENSDSIDFKQFDYVIDAIDTVSAKLCIIEKCRDENVPVISSMGTGNKLDPSKLEITDIYKTSVCPLARVMRYELRKRGIDRLTVVYSKEEPIKPDGAFCDERKGNSVPPGSNSFVPATAGLLIASKVVRDLISG